MTPEYASGIACLRSANNLDPVIRYAPASTGVHLTALGLLPLQYDCTMLFMGTDKMYSVPEQPHDIIHDRLLLCGDPDRGQHRGVMAHARHYILKNSSLLDFGTPSSFAPTMFISAPTLRTTLSSNDVLGHRPRLVVGQVAALEHDGDARAPRLRTQLMRNVRVTHNLAHTLDCDAWKGVGKAFFISNLPDDLSIDHNTILGTNWGVFDLTYAYSPPKKGERFALTNSAVWYGRYGGKTKTGYTPEAWAVDIGYAPHIEGLALRKGPSSGGTFGPGNVVIPEASFDASFNPDYSIKAGSAVAAVATTDGQPQGCDVTRLPMEDADGSMDTRRYGADRRGPHRDH